MKFLQWLAEQSRRLGGDVTVTGPVKSIAAHMMLLVIFVRQRIQISVLRQSLVKRGIEHRDVREIRKSRPRRADASHVRWIVERGQRRALVDLRQGRIIDPHACGKFFAAMHHPVADADQRELADLIQNRLQGFCVPRARQGQHRFPPVFSGKPQHGIRPTKFFRQPMCQHRFAGGGQQRTLQRGTPTINYQDGTHPWPKL